MVHSEKIIQLNKLLNEIELIKNKIVKLNNLIKNDFSEGKFGNREDCNGVLKFKMNGYLEETYKINMSDKIAKEINNLLKTSLSEETKILKNLELKYNNILKEIKI
jgi:hypothetical protein